MTQYQFDLLLKGGRVIDPANNVDALMDIAVSRGKIAAVAPDICADTAAEVRDVRGRIVLPGLIDIHTHVFEHVTGRFGLNPDMIGVNSGVTTVVDLGGAASLTFSAFRHFVAERAITRVFSFISPYLVGALESHGYPELYGPHGIDRKALLQTIETNRDLVRGLKMHAEVGGVSRWNYEVIEHAKSSAKEAGIPAYCHLGQMWPARRPGGAMPDPDAVFEAALDMLEPGDILAHPFSRNPGSFIGKNGEVNPAAKEAIARGLRVDVGRGGHISYDRARKVIDAGIIPYTAGSDLHGYNTRIAAERTEEMDLHPAFRVLMGKRRFGLHTVLSELIALGFKLEDVVPMVTTHPAQILNLSDEIGTLGVGRDADISVLRDERGKWTLIDQTGVALQAERMLYPDFCLRAGALFEASAPILSPLEEFETAA
ncbi:amidohydrolase/deacetylase family metallohydrolase [Erythrobacter sp. NFXS35]|uniref:amidohydrolase/deacetylase family metallohydrolase n=1 Tax=Erythrobacter sp. NFXS35 TaxID=2818436 RepID=UPI0032DEDD5B